jgi:hypothetical protein
MEPEQKHYEYAAPASGIQHYTVDYNNETIRYTVFISYQLVFNILARFPTGLEPEPHQNSTQSRTRVKRMRL